MMDDRPRAAMDHAIRVQEACLGDPGRGSSGVRLATKWEFNGMQSSFIGPFLAM